MSSDCTRPLRRPCSLKPLNCTDEKMPFRFGTWEEMVRRQDERTRRQVVTDIAKKSNMINDGHVPD